MLFFNNTHYCLLIYSIRNHRDLSGSTLRIANACYKAKSSILSNMCAIVTRPYACSWMLKDRSLQFRQPVDIDIDNQTSIQPQCIYISWPLGNVCIALLPAIHFMQWRNVLSECIVSRWARAKIIARHLVRIYITLRKTKLRNIAHLRCSWNKKNHYASPSRFVRISILYFVFISDSVISETI